MKNGTHNEVDLKYKFKQHDGYMYHILLCGSQIHANVSRFKKVSGLTCPLKCKTEMSLLIYLTPSPKR